MMKKHLIFIAMAATVSLTALWPLRALAYGSTYDGGMLEGMVEACTCSGGTTIRTSSYVDEMSHVYLYQLGATQLFANYNIISGGNYFLTTLAPYAVCMVYKGEECDSGSESPEGIFILTGTSFRYDKDSIMALLSAFPGAKELSYVVTSAMSPKGLLK